MSDPQPEPTPAPVPERTRLRDRLFGLRALAAVALAGVVLGGLGGVGIHAAADGDGGRDSGPGRTGPGQLPGQPGIPPPA